MLNIIKVLKPNGETIEYNNDGNTSLNNMIEQVTSDIDGIILKDIKVNIEKVSNGVLYILSINNAKQDSRSNKSYKNPR